MILAWSVFTWIVFIFTDVYKIWSWIVSGMAWGFQSNTVYIKSAKIKFPLGISWWLRGILYDSIGITLQSFIRYQSIVLSTRCISVTNARVCYYQFLKCMTVFCQQWIIAWPKCDRAEMPNNGSWHIALDRTSKIICTIRHYPHRLGTKIAVWWTMNADDGFSFPCRHFVTLNAIYIFVKKFLPFLSK